MIVDFPYTYRAAIIRPRCRIEETVTAIAWHPVRLRAVSTAPVAAVAEPATRADTPGAPVVYRNLGGALYRPVTQSPRQAGGENVVGADGLAAYTAECARAWQVACGNVDLPFAMQQGNKPDWVRKIHLRHASQADLPEHRQLLSTDQAESRNAMVRAAARDLAMIGDVLHVRTLGPAWSLDVRHDADGASAALKVVADLNLCSRWVLSLCFRGDRQAAALDLAGVLAPGQVDIPVCGTIEVRDPAALAAAVDDERAAAYGAAVAVLERLRSTIARLPGVAIRAYGDIKDAVSEGGTDPAPVVAALRVLERHWRDHDEWRELVSGSPLHMFWERQTLRPEHVVTPDQPAPPR